MCPLSHQSLSPSLRARIEQLTSLDAMLYSAAVSAFESALADAMGAEHSAARAAWDADAAEISALQRALARTLSIPRWRARRPCRALHDWYSQSDVQYEASIDKHGRAAAPPAAEHEAMMDAYRRTGGQRFC